MGAATAENAPTAPMLCAELLSRWAEGGLFLPLNHGLEIDFYPAILAAAFGGRVARLGLTFPASFGHHALGVDTCSHEFGRDRGGSRLRQLLIIGGRSLVIIVGEYICRVAAAASGYYDVEYRDW